jgi:hypothetical protein
MQHFERARTIYATGHQTSSVANTGLGLADTLWRDDGDARRARALVESAAEVFAEAEMWESLAEAQQWLATHELGGDE